MISYHQHCHDQLLPFQHQHQHRRRRRQQCKDDSEEGTRGEGGEGRMELGPYFAKLPIELVLEIAHIVCSFSQHHYMTLLLVCRRFHELCRWTGLSYVPVVLEKPDQTALFTRYLSEHEDEDVGLRIKRLWIVKEYPYDERRIIPRCTNLVSLACDGHDLVPIVESKSKKGTFRHTHLVDLTIMGLWDFWAPFLRSEYGERLCRQLERLWLLDHLFIRGVDTRWWASLKELYYWSVEARSGAGMPEAYREQFRDEVELLREVKTLEKFRVIMHYPSQAVFEQVKRIGDRRLEVLPWGKRSEVVEWMNQRL